MAVLERHYRLGRVTLMPEISKARSLHASNTDMATTR